MTHKNFKIAYFLIFVIFVKSCPEDYCFSCAADNSGVCEGCEESVFISKKNTCDRSLHKIDHCKIYAHDDPTSCVACEWGFGFVTEEKACKACTDQNCAICDSSLENCSACLDDLVLTELDKRIICTKDQSFENPNCAISQSTKIKETKKEKKCISCKSGYSTSGFQCVSEPFPDCESVEKNVCLQCKYGFYQTQDQSCHRNGSTPHPQIKVLLYAGLIALVIGGAGILYLVLKNKRKSEEELLLIK